MSGEEDFVAILRGLARDPAARGLVDDTAVLEIGGEALILTHDMIVEGVHVPSGQDPADIAWKLVATNLSDLAAKGAEPLGVLLGHMLGGDDARFAQGLREVLSRYGVPLLGGDTVSGGPPRAWGLTALGRATFRPVPARSGAKPGDTVFVTGTLGAAMAGFEALRDQTGGDSTRYLRPLPRLTEGQRLAPHVSAMMDVSDGLLLDSWRLAQASGVTLALESAAVPLAVPEKRRGDALRWGDDYELLFTLPANTSLPEGLPAKASRIGVVEQAGLSPLTLDGRPLSGPDGLGYQHR